MNIRNYTNEDHRLMIKSKKILYIFLLLIFAFRLLSLIPLILDEDEAWFSISAATLHSPFDFFIKTIDNKPPGTVWYFWMIQNLFHTGMDPRFARLGFIFITFLTAFLIWKIACRLKKTSAGIAAVSFLLLSVIPYPKMLATTTEGLMLPLICCVMLLLLPLKQSRWVIFKNILAGILFCFTLLLKQTALFFIFPVLYLLYKRKKWVAAFIFAITCIISVTLFVSYLGANDFWYWNYIYPKNILEKVRTHLFSIWTQFGVNVFILALLAWPITFLIFKKFKKLTKKENGFLLLWMGAAIASLFITKGLFFHYFLLLLPPLCILIADSRLPWRWLGSCYAVICLLSAMPAIQSFWGIDLNYYQKLDEIVQTYTNPNDKIFIWGGNAIAHITSKRLSIEKFITTRFAAPPYSTAALEKEFEEKFLSDKPSMVIDLHERGDNRFNYPILIYPWLEDELKKSYSSFQTPELPWARFYSRTNHPAQITSTQAFSPLPFDDLYKELYLKVKQDPFTYINHFSQIESYLRLWEGLRSVHENHVDSAYDPRFLNLYHELQKIILENPLTAIKASEFREKLLSLIKKYNLPLPMPLKSSFMWWVSFALVKLQPVANGL